MSDRLTSPNTTSSSLWPELALCAALLLTAIHRNPILSEETGLEPWRIATLTGFRVLLALQGGTIVRGMLPPKSPASQRCFAACLGVLSTTLLVPFAELPSLLAWMLALSAWNFFHHEESASPPSMLLSGLCAGFACTFDLTVLLVAIPLFVLNILLFLNRKARSVIAPSLWETGLILGLIPFLFQQVPLPAWSWDPARLTGLSAEIRPLLAAPFFVLMPILLLGAGVASFQARKTFFALLLPLLAGLPLLRVFDPDLDLLESLTLPVALLSAYGATRFVKGVEQGVRNSSSGAAKKVFPGAVILLLVSVTGWIGLQIMR